MGSRGCAGGGGLRGVRPGGAADGPPPSSCVLVHAGRGSRRVRGRAAACGARREAGAATARGGPQTSCAGTARLPPHRVHALRVLQHLLDERRHRARDLHLQCDHPLGACGGWDGGSAGRGLLAPQIGIPRQHLPASAPTGSPTLALPNEHPKLVPQSTAFPPQQPGAEGGCDPAPPPHSPLALMLRRSVIFISILGNMWGLLGLLFLT